MYFLFPALLAIFISFLVVRAAAIALMMTGLDKNRAIFQALSSFTGTGFTTKEAESVVRYPARRKIISWLMILGNAGIVTVIITATSSMVTTQMRTLPINILLLVLGIVAIYKVATSKGFVKRWEHYIEDKLIKYRPFEEAPVEDLLHLLEGFGLVRVIISEDSKWVGTAITDICAGERGMIFLGIERGKEWIPAPASSETVRADDRLVVYGELDVLKAELRED
ncbi:MAG: TrkA C-terminal domain-containing protein [Nitrospirota bacterium]